MVAFSSNRGDGTIYQIWTMRVHMNDLGQAIAGDIVQLTHNPGDKRQPAWSPNGGQIAYSAPGEKGASIWVVNTDGSGEPVAITDMRGDETDPAWSPDGNWIAFTSDAREDHVLMLYLIHPDGSGLVKLSSFQYEFGPAWSPSMQLGFVMNIGGNQVLYIRGQKDPKPAPHLPSHTTSPLSFSICRPSMATWARSLNPPGRRMAIGSFTPASAPGAARSGWRIIPCASRSKKTS